MPLLLLIRHGENDYTRTGKLAGRMPGIGLNERGRKQAEELAKALANAPLEALYSSPLEREMQTAEPIGKALGLNRCGAWLCLSIGAWCRARPRGLGTRGARASRRRRCALCRPWKRSAPDTRTAP